MRECPECGAEVAPAMKFCAECGTQLEAGQSTVSYAPSFGEELEQAAGGTDGAALIEMDQVEGTAGRRMHDLADEVVTVGRGQESDIFLVQPDQGQLHHRRGRRASQARVSQPLGQQDPLPGAAAADQPEPHPRRLQAVLDARYRAPEVHPYPAG